VGYLCANFSLPRPLCSRLRPDVRDRQTSDRRQTSDAHHRLMSPRYGGGVIIIATLRMCELTRAETCDRWTCNLLQGTLTRILTRITHLVYSTLVQTRLHHWYIVEAESRPRLLCTPTTISPHSSNNCTG